MIYCLFTHFIYAYVLTRMIHLSERVMHVRENKLVQDVIKRKRRKMAPLFDQGNTAHVRRNTDFFFRSCQTKRRGYDDNGDQLRKKYMKQVDKCSRRRNLRGVGWVVS